MSQSAETAGAECCADCPAGAGCAAGVFTGSGYAAGAYAAEPVPVLGPYIGVVGAVLCALVGAFLLLAPYAFDYRDGAASTPHSSVVDLATGGGVLLLGLLTAALFGGTLIRRLRLPETATYDEPLPDSVEEAVGEGTSAQDPADPHTQGAQAATANAYATASAAPSASAPSPSARSAAEGMAPASEPEARPAAPAASLADPGGALRDLLTPLVAALAADLRARENGESEGNRL